jgi:hypothetical protein
MFNTKFFTVLLLFFSTVAKNLNADNRIVIYLKTPPPGILKQAITQAKKEITPSDKQAIPSKTVKKQINGKAQAWLTPKLSGFIAIYAGFMDISDRQGLVSFPLRHTTPKINVAVTEQINLVKVKENTISHREFLPQNQVESKLYTFERKEDINPKDPTKKTIYWSVKEIPLPADNKINPLTLVILTKPENLFIPVGDFMAVESNHLVLPEIYVIGNMDQENILLQALDFSRYFETITIEDKKIDDKKKESLIKNI